VSKSGVVRTHPGLTVPGEKGGTLDGFFIARFRRR
jgi:16S rRNA (cytosine967-C5)-methyltransferase